MAGNMCEGEIAKNMALRVRTVRQFTLNLSKIIFFHITRFFVNIA